MKSITSKTKHNIIKEGRWLTFEIIKAGTLIPLKVYLSNNKIKILVGVCKGKHTYDKRQTLKDKQVKRDIDRSLKYI